MRTTHQAVALFATMLLSLAACESGRITGSTEDAGRIVVANRSGASLSIIDAGTDSVLQTIPLPPGEKTAEPVYLAYTRAGNRLWIGDRANDRLLIYDAAALSRVSSVPTGRGNAHIQVSSDEKQLWVSNDIDNTLTVVNPATATVITTIPLASDLKALGGQVHDIAIDVTRGRAYVTVRNATGDDWVVAYNTSTFAEVNRAQVGENPHVVVDGRGGLLHVMAENGWVRSFDPNLLTKARETALTGAHGAVLSPNGDVLYAANFLSTDGNGALYAFRSSDLTPLGAPVSTSFGKPHHMTVTPNGKLYMTHSSANLDKVTVYTIANGGALTFSRAVTVGLNPQGIVRIPD